MEAVISASFGVRKPDIKAINLANREFYDKQDQKFRRLLDDPRKAEAAYSQLSGRAKLRPLPTSRQISLELLRRTQPYEQRLFEIASY